MRGSRAGLGAELVKHRAPTEMALPMLSTAMQCSAAGTDGSTPSRGQPCRDGTPEQAARRRWVGVGAHRSGGQRWRPGPGSSRVAAAARGTSVLLRTLLPTFKF